MYVKRVWFLTGGISQGGTEGGSGDFSGGGKGEGNVNVGAFV